MTLGAETGEAVAQMETQTQEVELGTKAAQSAGSTLENIVTVSAESSRTGVVDQSSRHQTGDPHREMIQTVNIINKVVTESSEQVRETRRPANN